MNYLAYVFATLFFGTIILAVILRIKEDVNRPPKKCNYYEYRISVCTTGFCLRYTNEIEHLPNGLVKFTDPKGNERVSNIVDIEKGNFEYCYR